MAVPAQSLSASSYWWLILGRKYCNNRRQGKYGCVGRCPPRLHQLGCEVLEGIIIDKHLCDVRPHFTAIIAISVNKRIKFESEGYTCNQEEA